MKRANDIAEELKEMGSMLGNIDRRMPYSVPAGYFDQFENNVWETIEDLGKPEAVPGWSKTMPYSVPGGYFDNLAGNIIANLQAEETITGLPKELPYSAPAGYFEALPAQILEAAKASEPVKKKAVVIPLKKTYTIRPVRWAAAAILLICISLGGYMFFSAQQSMPEQMLASVPASEIHDYLQHTYRIDVDRVVNSDDVSNLQLENKEIIEYLNETGWDVAE